MGLAKRDTAQVQQAFIQYKLARAHFDRTHGMACHTCELGSLRYLGTQTAIARHDWKWTKYEM